MQDHQHFVSRVNKIDTALLTTKYNTPFKPPYFALLADSTCLRNSQIASVFQLTCSLQANWASLGWSVNANYTNCKWRGLRQRERRQKNKGVEMQQHKSTKCATVQCLIKFSMRGICQEWSHCLRASGKAWHASVRVVLFKNRCSAEEMDLVHLGGEKKRKRKTIHHKWTCKTLYLWHVE